MRASGLPLEIRFTGASQQRFAGWLGEDLEYAEQGAGSLGERLCRATAQTPVILIGADCPDLTPKHLVQAAQALQDDDIVIGPAEDGGYYLLGLRRPLDRLFSNISWGTATVLAETVERLESYGLEPVWLETLADCDRPEDLQRWPELAS
jgi:rSAM/selenodomain-associated transferase 1